MSEEEGRDEGKGRIWKGRVWVTWTEKRTGVKRRM